MWSWMHRRTRASTPSMHPPSRVGQYVTYYMEMNDGYWAALALQLIGRTKDKAWLVQVNMKDAGGDARVMLGVKLETTSGKHPELPVLIASETVRTSSSEGAHPPLLLTPVAMNLLLPCLDRPRLRELGEPRKAEYPCNISSARPWITSIGYEEKHHYLSRQVPITGIASMTFKGGRNPIIVTSFGLADAEVQRDASYDDFVDLAYPKTVDHGSFKLTYPATWFLRSQDRRDEDAGPEDQLFVGAVGGSTCSAGIYVRVCHGALGGGHHDLESIPDQLAEVAKTGRWVSRKKHFQQHREETAYCAYDLEDQDMNGFTAIAAYEHAQAHLTAEVGILGLMLKMNPRAKDTLPIMETAFQKILESFEFSAGSS